MPPETIKSICVAAVSVTAIVAACFTRGDKALGMWIIALAAISWMAT